MSKVVSQPFLLKDESDCESDCLEDHHNVTDEVVDGLDGIIKNSQ